MKVGKQWNVRGKNHMKSEVLKITKKTSKQKRF